MVTGIISNSDERYADGVLPMLQLTEQIDFFVFSKKVDRALNCVKAK